MIMISRWQRVAATVCGAVLCGVSVSARQSGESSSFSIAPTGYIQLDFRAFPQWNVAPGTGRLNRDAVEARRARVGIEGRWKAMTFEFSADPLDADDDAVVKDAFVELRLGRRRRLQMGQFKLPGSREYDGPARRTDFLERSVLAGSLAAGRDIGVMFDGRIGRVRYEAGGFLGDGQGRRERAGMTGAGRINWEPRRGLEIGGYGAVSRTEAVDTEAGNGLDGRSSAGYRFFDRVYVQGRRVRVGGDVEWTRGPWRLTTEALRVTDQRREQGVDFDDLPVLLAQSWTVAGSRRFGRPRNAAARPEPLGRAERWPWQLAVRFEHAEFDDEGAATGRDSTRPRAADVRNRGVDSLTTGLTYQATRWLRLVGDGGVERYSESRTAPQSGRRSYLTAGLRLQFEWP